MNFKWKYKELVTMQAGGLLLTHRSERRYDERGMQHPIVMIFYILVIELLIKFLW